MLVAGYATRLYPLTENMPKGLLQLNGKTIIDYAFEKLEKIQEIDEAILVSNHKFYKHFVDWANQYQGRIKLTVLDDGTTSNDNRLGAIGDIQFSIDQCKIDDDVMVLASDNYFTFQLSDYYNFFKQKHSDCILGCEFDDLDYLAHNFGVAILDKDGRVKDMVEKPGVALSNVGIWAIYIYTKDTIKMIKQYLAEGNSKDAPGNFPSWLCHKKPVYAYLFQGECYDIGTIKVYNELNDKLTNNSTK